MPGLVNDYYVNELMHQVFEVDKVCEVVRVDAVIEAHELHQVCGFR